MHEFYIFNGHTVLHGTLIFHSLGILFVRECYYSINGVHSWECRLQENHEKFVD